MKWSVVGLFSLGIVAALAGVVLVLSLQPSARAAGDPVASSDGPEHEVEVLVAARDLEPRTVVGAGDLVVRHVPASAAPEGAFGDPVQVVGRVLVVRMQEGQVFHPTSFASSGSGLLLASALAPGTRAVGVTLTDEMGIEELLYPGCLVDVLAGMEVDSNDGLGEQPISFTLLSSVMVLAVGKRTVVSELDASGGASHRTRPTVTLLLDPEQAEKLKLAVSEGSISLVMRSPVDDGSFESTGTTRAALSPKLRDAERAAVERLVAEALARREEELAREREELEQSRRELESERDELLRLAAAGDARAQTPRWESVVLRGGEAETKSFDLEREER